MLRKGLWAWSRAPPRASALIANFCDRPGRRVGEVHCGQGQARATEPHRTGPTTPYPGLRPRFPFSLPRISEFHSGGKGCPACHLGPRQSQGHPLYEGGARPNSRPGLAEPGAGTLSTEPGGCPGPCPFTTRPTPLLSGVPAQEGRGARDQSQGGDGAWGLRLLVVYL